MDLDNTREKQAGSSGGEAGVRHFGPSGRCAEAAAHTPAVRELRGPHVACRQCGMFALCLPVGVGPADLGLLERVIKRRRVVARGERIFRSGDAFHSVYALKSGSIKTCLPLDSQCAQVVGFHLPGEIIGLDAVGAGSYQYDARALETSSLCEVPFDKLEHLGMLVRSMQQQMLRIMSGQIRHDLLLHVMHCRKTAEARLAGFLLNLSVRFESRNFSGSEIRLSMSREDIGNYLGLTKETVCRLFTGLKERQLVSINDKRLRILDRPRLETIAGLTAGECRPLQVGTYPSER